MHTYVQSTLYHTYYYPGQRNLFVIHQKDLHQTTKLYFRRQKHIYNSIKSSSQARSSQCGVAKRQIFTNLGPSHSIFCTSLGIEYYFSQAVIYCFSLLERISRSTFCGIFYSSITFEYLSHFPCGLNPRDFCQYKLNRRNTIIQEDHVLV